MKFAKALLLTAFLVLPFAAQAQQLNDGEALVRAMYSRYQTSWYKTLTFTQKSTTYNPDGTTKVETWYEAALLPGKLRINIGAPSENNGYLMTDGTLNILKAGQVTKTRPYVNILLVLGFDVYTQSPETSDKVLKAEGYDLSKIHEDTWEGKPAYVVGADKGDSKTKQFWIDKATLLFVRVIEPARSDPNTLDDVRFTSYHKYGEAWLAERVEVHSAVNGKDALTFSEDYSDVKISPKLDPATFDPKQFSATHWEKP
jgi:outer membrane lipoprotein-sorting protein